MYYKTTAKRVKAEAAYAAKPSARTFKTLSKASKAEMDEVLAAFDARNKA